MRSLKEIVTDIVECEANMALEPNAVDIRVRAGVEATVRNATTKYPALKQEYREAIGKNVLLIGVYGKGAMEFTNIAKYVFKTAVANFNSAPDRIKQNFINRSARRDFQNQEMFLLLDELNRMKLDYGILSIPQPSFQINNQQIFGQNTDWAIDTVLRHNYGDQIHTVGILHEIAELAFKAKFAGTLLPVVIYNDSTDYLKVDENILPNFHTVCEAPENVDDAFVEKVLSDVRKSLKATVEEPTPIPVESVSTEEVKAPESNEVPNTQAVEEFKAIEKADEKQDNKTKNKNKNHKNKK